MFRSGQICPKQSLNILKQSFVSQTFRFTPGAKFARKWENAMTLDTHSWGYRRNAKLQDYYSSKVNNWRLHF